MRVNELITRAACVMAAAFCVSCHGGKLTTGQGSGAGDITQVRRVVIFPFLGDTESSDRFYGLAAEQLWPEKVVPQLEVQRVLQEMGLDPRAKYLSKDQAILIGGRLGADAVVVGYMDPQRTLRVRAVNVVSLSEWARDRRLSGGEDIRTFVEEVKADIKNSRDTVFKKPVKKGPRVPVKKTGVVPVKSRTAERVLVEAVSVSTFTAIGVKDLLPPETVLPPTQVAPFGETSVFGFDYGSLGGD